MRRCLADGCAVLISSGSRCARHRAEQRAKYGGDWPAHARAVIAAHVGVHGWICPGWDCEAHESHDLTLDHGPPERVLCRSCNSRKRNLGGG